MAELWDIYDKNRIKTGRTIERGQPMTENEYHIVVQVWIRNSNGQWLISRRSPGKSMPLKWEPTGGSVLAGEDSLTGALREVREELGVVLKPDTGRLLYSFRRDKASWEKSPVPVMVTDPSHNIYGPGHNSFTKDKDGRDLLVFHARPYPGFHGTPLSDPNRHCHVWPVEYDENDRPIFN